MGFGTFLKGRGFLISPNSSELRAPSGKRRRSEKKKKKGPFYEKQDVKKSPHLKSAWFSNTVVYFEVLSEYKSFIALALGRGLSSL